MASALYIVATPIGNLGDITLRALEVLRAVDIIICEDTRETQKLLTHYTIEGKKLMSYHARSRVGRAEEVLAHCASGKSAAVVSDRGSPGISDPGSRLVARARALGITVIPIPGPSAFLTALQGAGCHTAQFIFWGFLPHKKGRQTNIHAMVAEPRTIVFYESVHRIEKIFTELMDAGVGARRVIVARELTKVYEEFFHGTAAEILTALTESNGEKIHGEFVVILDAI